jgi:hypothetical protein
MTAKEEAEELVDKFTYEISGIDKYNYCLDSHIRFTAKQCAINAIEFAADQFEKYCCAEIGLHWTKDDEYTDGSWDHFNYIKQEVEKL